MSEAAAGLAELAFLFPGQGSQKVGMGKALADSFSLARTVFEEADAALGFSLSRLCFEGPESELVLTANAQPAILTTSIAALRVLEDETSLRPTVVAGHSLGEYSALVCARALALGDAVRLVRLRGELMQEAVPAGTGGMAAILGLDAEQVNAACQEAMTEGMTEGMTTTETTSLGATVSAGPVEVVSAANLNGGGQIVIAGHKGAVQRACAAAKRRGAKAALPLAVSAPFHSALMRPAAERLAAELARVDIRDPAVPVISNVDAAPNRDGGRVRDLLTRQVTAAVRWEDTVLRLVAMNVTEAIEVGQGGVLAGLVKRIARTIRVRGAGDPKDIAALGGAGASTGDGAEVKQEKSHA